MPLGFTWRGELLSDAVDKVIAEELGLPFETQELNLADETEAHLWVIDKTLENPELNPFQKIRRHLARKDLLLKLGRERMAKGGEGSSEMSNLEPHDTRGADRQGQCQFGGTGP